MFDPRTIVGIVLLIPVAFGWIGQRSIQVVLLAVGSNFMWLVGAQLDLRRTGIAIATITILGGLALTLYIPIEMMRRRKAQAGDDPEDRGPDVPLLAMNRYGDLTTPLLDVVMLFSGQTMLIALYLNEMARTPDHYPWFNSALWACGWVCQFMAYTAFNFDFKGEANFWRRLMQFGGTNVLCRQGTKSTLVHVDLNQLAFRSVLSCLVNVVYRFFVWMSLPIYICRGHGGMQIVMKCVAVMFILTVSDLGLPIRLESPESSDKHEFKRREQEEHHLLTGPEE